MRNADSIFRSELERRTGARWAVRQAMAGDSAFLSDLFAQVGRESVERLGGDASLFIAGPLLELQIEAQARAYRAAYPLALSYIVVSQPGGSPAGRLLIDWPTAPQPSQLIDIAIAPGARAGAIGLHLLRAWLATCARLALDASLNVVPHNPARRLYRRLGFTEADPTAFPVAMHRSHRAQRSPAPE